MKTRLDVQLRLLFLLICFQLGGLSHAQDSEETYRDSIRDVIIQLRTNAQFEEVIAITEEVLQKKEKKTLALGYHWRAITSDEMGNSELALTSYYDALEIYEEIKDTVGIANTYSGIGIVFYSIRNRKRGKEYMLKAARHLESNFHPRFKSKIAAIYLNLGNIYLTMFSENASDDYVDSSKHYYDRAEKLYLEIEDDYEIRNTLILLHSNYTILLSLDRDPEYMDHFNRVSNEVRQENDSLNLCILFTAHAEYLFKGESVKEALSWSDSAFQYMPSWEPKSFMYDHYSLRADILRELDRAEEALKCSDIADSISAEFLAPEKIGDLISYSDEQEKIAAIEKKDAAMEEESAKFSSTLSTALWIIASCVIGLGLAFVVILRLRKNRNKLSTELADSEQEKIQFKTELNQYKEDVEELIRKVEENKLSKKDKEKQPSSYNLILDEITDQVDGKKHFEDVLEKAKQINPSFLHLLKTKYPSLSKNEIRLCVYLLMGMTSKEIAQVVNIEPASVDRRRYRLRKKLDFGEKGNLVAHLEELEREALTNE